MTERIRGFTDLCTSAEVKKYIEENSLCAREITYAAYQLTQRYQCERASFIYANRRAPGPGELIGDGFVDLFGVLIEKGLEQGLDYMSSDGGVSEESVLLSVLSLDNRNAALDTARLLLDFGFDPEYRPFDRSIIETVECDIVDASRGGGEDHNAFECGVYSLLLLYSYGAELRRFTVTLSDGYGREKLRDHRNLKISKEHGIGKTEVLVADSSDGAPVARLGFNAEV